MSNSPKYPNISNSSQHIRQRQDFLDQDEINRIKEKRKACLKENASCATCSLGSPKFDKIVCSAKANKLVNTYNYCERFKPQVIESKEVK